VSQLIIDTKGNLDDFDKLINNLCEDIIKNKQDSQKNHQEILIQNLTQNKQHENFSCQILDNLDSAVNEIINQAALNTSLKYITSSNILKHIHSIFKVKKEEKCEKNQKMPFIKKDLTVIVNDSGNKISDENLENLIDKFVESYDNKSNDNIKTENESLDDILNSMFKNENEKLNLPYFSEKEESCLPYNEMNEPFKFSSNGELYQRTIEGAIIETFMGEYSNQDNIFKSQDMLDSSLKNQFNFFEKSEKGEKGDKADKGDRGDIEESNKFISGLLNKKRSRGDLTQDN
jgi:hypothetical protein